MIKAPYDVQISFTVDRAGTYVAQLIVNDGQVESDPATTTVTTLNTKPEANAGSDQTVYVGGTVTLDGSKSTDVDGDLLTYRWSFTSRPAGSAAELSNSGDVNLFFYSDQLVILEGEPDRGKI